MSITPAIECENIDVLRGKTRILHNVSCEVAQGESVALIGNNGSGKSTLVRAILGIYPLSAGRVRLFGHDAQSEKSAIDFSTIGYVPQRIGAGTGVPATALEVVASGLIGPGRFFAARGKKARARALDALARVGLYERAHDHVQVFSGGQLQRTLIARALVKDPSLLILDEPLSGIDHESQHSLAHIIGELRERNVTLVTVLHEMGELAPLIDRCIQLENGHVASSHANPQPPLFHDHPSHDHQHEHESPHADAHHAPVLKMEMPHAS